MYCSNKKGIAPIFDFIKDEINLENFSAYDTVVGKAIVSIFIKLGIKYVYGKVMSKSAQKMLENHNVKYGYDRLVDSIINRTQTDICPMEKVVLNLNDIEECFKLLKTKNEELNK